MWLFDWLLSQYDVWHMSLHLAINDQLSIDQPPGIKLRDQALPAQHGEPHAALHDVMDCLTEMIWRAQRDQAPFDAVVYLNCIDAKLRKYRPYCGSVLEAEVQARSYNHLLISQRRRWPGYDS